MIINKDTYDFDEDINNHKSRVQELMNGFSLAIKSRGDNHDNSKLREPEYSIYKEFTPKLNGVKYQSDTYKKITHDKRFRSAIDHHKSYNQHHPEYFKNGINDMTLVDILEMLCDWKSASERHHNASWEDGFNYNCDKYNIDPQLRNILWNTYKRFITMLED